MAQVWHASYLSLLFMEDWQQPSHKNTSTHPAICPSSFGLKNTFSILLNL
jgi:hypothetical protein